MNLGVNLVRQNKHLSAAYIVGSANDALKYKIEFCRFRAPMKFSCFSGGPNFYKSNNQRIFAPRDNSSAQIERYSPEPKIGSAL
jgi:hypothetical protein